MKTRTDELWIGDKHYDVRLTNNHGVWTAVWWQLGLWRSVVHAGEGCGGALTLAHRRAAEIEDAGGAIALPQPSAAGAEVGR